MENDYCEDKHKMINHRLDTHDSRLNKHSEEIDTLRLDMLAQQKDSTQLRQAIESLQKSIYTLIDEIGKLKAKPLERYEKVILVVITFIITFILNRALGV